MESTIIGNNIKISVISDSHLLPRDMISNNPEYLKALGTDRKFFTESEGLLRSSIDLIEKNDSDVILITGDLTKDGEYIGHEYFASLFQEYRDKRPGRFVFPIIGNHDVNSSNSYDYNYHNTEMTRKTKRATPRDILEIYEELLYGEVIEKYKDSQLFKDYLASVNKSYEREPGSEYYAQGYTSYVSRVGIGNKGETCGLTIIGLDTLQYSAEVAEGNKDGVNDPSGSLSIPLLKWAIDKSEEGRARNDVVIAIAHHGFLPHFYNQDLYLKPYIIRNWNEKIQDSDDRINGKTPPEALADNGISVVFTGHMHAQDIAKMTTENDNSFYDIETGSVVTYPLPVRHILLNNNLDSEKSSYSLDVTSEFIKNFSYKNLDGNEVTVVNGQDYSSRNLITADLVAGLAEYKLKTPHISSLTSKEITINELSKRIDGLKADNFNTLIKYYLRKNLGSKKKPKISMDLKPVKFFGTPKLNVYFGKVKHTEKYGKGNKIAIDVTIKGEVYPFMIRGKNIVKLMDNIFEQIDGKFLKDTDLVYKWTKRLVSAMLFHEVFSNGEKNTTISDVMNYSYLSHLKGRSVNLNGL